MTTSLEATETFETATAVTAEELAALAAVEAEAKWRAQLKKSAPITDEEMELVVRYRELNKLLAPLEVEKKAINALLSESILSRGIGQLTKDGVTQVALTPTGKDEIDTKALAEDEPEIAARYTVRKLGTRFDAKK